MRDVWTNITWANWLEGHDVPKGHHALLETNGYGLPKKVITISKKGEDLFNHIPTDKHWTIASWYSSADGYKYVSSLHPSANFIEEHYKKNKKKRKR